ncbi:hypothetical protein NGRA_3115 [Nosema granulosis]|uniref:Uncharacterized protein n=1 Tax=Nosema granulosis TaxID=83296 RepID=A0A9P6KXI9_9MICR|nr:hypothetical protein NGRA_3115 [Nosema granulosis]
MKENDLICVELEDFKKGDKKNQRINQCKDEIGCSLRRYRASVYLFSNREYQSRIKVQPFPDTVHSKRRKSVSIMQMQGASSMRSIPVEIKQPFPRVLKSLNKQGCWLNHDILKHKKKHKGQRSMKKVKSKKREMRYDGGMCGSDEEMAEKKIRRSESLNTICSKEKENSVVEESFLFATPHSVFEESIDFDLIGWMMKNGSSIEDSSAINILEGLKESLLGEKKTAENILIDDSSLVSKNMVKKECDLGVLKSKEEILSKLLVMKPTEDEIETLLFGRQHNFKEYQEPGFRDLLQLAHASSLGLQKELLRLKLLQYPERIDQLAVRNSQNERPIVYQNERPIVYQNERPIFLDQQSNEELIQQSKDYIFDLYYYFSKKDLEKQEIGIFNKIIYWLTCFSRDLPHSRCFGILSRVKMELLFYNPMYLVIIEFIEEIIKSKVI